MVTFDHNPLADGEELRRISPGFIVGLVDVFTATRRCYDE